MALAICWQSTSMSSNPDPETPLATELPPTSTPPNPAIFSHEAWKLFIDQFAKADELMVEGWKKDIDAYLIFSGLSSAVITTFVVDSYKNLQQDSSVITNQILAQISQQLASFSLNVGTVNSTVGPINLDIFNASFSPSPISVRVNALWLVSLIFSIGMSALAIAIRQWLQEFLRYPLTPQRDPAYNARLRIFRSRSLSKWGVPYLLVALPVLLQISLAMFFTGLLIQLWAVDKLIAQIATASVIAMLFFSLGTSLLPTFFPDCPYRSPQAFALYFWIKLSTAIVVFICTSPIAVLTLVLSTCAQCRQAPQRFYSWWEVLEGMLPDRDWGGRDTRSQHLQLSKLEREFLALADQSFTMDDEKTAHGLVACFKTGTMQYMNAAITLEVLVRQGCRGNRGFVILMEKINSMLATLNAQAQEEQKQMLEVVEQVNTMINDGRWERNPTILNQIHNMEHYLADALSRTPNDTDVGIHRQLCSTLVGALAISISSHDTLKYEQDSVVFDALVIEAGGFLDTKEMSPLFYGCCAAILHLCYKVPIADETLSQRHDSILLVIRRLKTHLQEHGIGDDYEGDEWSGCFLEFATTFLDDLIAFAGQYPDSDFVDPITRVIEVYANRIVDDMGGHCVKYIAYYNKHSVDHRERYDLLRKGREWLMEHPLAPDEN